MKRKRQTSILEWATIVTNDTIKRRKYMHAYNEMKAQEKRNLALLLVAIHVQESTFQKCRSLYIYIDHYRLYPPEVLEKRNTWRNDPWAFTCLQTRFDEMLRHHQIFELVKNWQNLALVSKQIRNQLTWPIFFGFG